MLDWRITSHHPSDTLGTCIRYCSADLYNTYTMYHPPDVRWHVLNDTMSQYYLCHHRIFGLNALVYQYNHEKWQTTGLPILDAMTISCITMVGTQPTFHLVSGTQALSIAVVTGQYPEALTKVVKCVTFLTHNC